MQAKDERLELRLPAEMKNAIERAAESEGLKPSQFMRRLFLEWQKREARRERSRP